MKVINPKEIELERSELDWQVKDAPKEHQPVFLAGGGAWVIKLLASIAFCVVGKLFLTGRLP